MTDKQFMEQLAFEAEKLTLEQKAYILGAARGMGLRTQFTANHDENDESQGVK